MKLKKRYLFSLLIITGLFALPAHADDTVSQEDHPMGYYIQQEQKAILAQENLPAPQPQIAPLTPETETEDTVTPTNSTSSSDVHISALSSTLNANDTSLPRRDVVDIASHQYWMTQADFNALKSAGVKTIVVKLTQGT